MDSSEALYRREMGLPYDQTAYLRAVANGDAGYRGRPTDELPGRKHYFEYDGNDDFGSLYERPIGNVEVVTDTHTNQELLEIAGKRVTGLIDLYNEHALTKQDITDNSEIAEVITQLGKVKDEEDELVLALETEHPKFTAAIAAWMQRNESYADGVSDGYEPEARMEFLEDLMIDLARDITDRNKEYAFWAGTDENAKYKSLLMNDLEYLYAFQEVCHHHYLSAVAQVIDGDIKKLYDLAA